MGTVGADEAREVVPLHDACEAPALAGARNVDDVALGEHVICLDDIASAVLASELGGDTNFCDVTGGSLKACLLGMTELCLGSAGGLLLTDTELECVVAIVGVSRLDLKYGAWTEVDDSYTGDVPVLGEELGHSDLVANQAWHRVWHVSSA